MKFKKLWWQSSYDRGLDILLELWPEIKKAEPNATLDICYGWDLYDKASVNNPERQQWKAKVQELMQQPGITHHGRIGQNKMKKLRRKCGILAYPTYFPEIFMIGAVEAQNDGLVPVCTPLAALPETAKNGFFSEGDINTPQGKESFLQTLLSVMGDKEKWTKAHAKCKAAARNYKWESQADKWIKVFKQPKPQPKITVYTPTIREGFWNLMSNNLAAQEYRNFEWLIVDDHKDNRESIAKKYAEKYGIEIRYVRGKKQTPKRNYALVNANNTMIEHATGETVVFLQDFILLRPDALTQVAEFCNHHPIDLYAPVDVYYNPKIKPDLTNKEDWFNGQIDVAGEHLRDNKRMINKGFRRSKDATEFEANWGAIPLKVMKELNGFWEYMDDGLGFDNADIAYRAMQAGSKLYIDEHNIALCIDHWEALGRTENGTRPDRSINLNDPRFEYLIQMVESKNWGVVRDEEIDRNTSLQYEIPKEINTEDIEAIADWVVSNKDQIVKRWLRQVCC
jgi:glycosyltransferase involved in cell wall biosynthesis